MPIKIIRQDITRIKCDAIVNPTNRKMCPTGGVDAAIYKAVGDKLAEYCLGIGELSVGEARITPAFDLPCKYVIHTVGPKWRGGFMGEQALLRSCYLESLRLACENGCESIAFPLISSGENCYPKASVLKEATEAIAKFLEQNEMDVYIVVFDKTSYSISKELFTNVLEFIDNFYDDSSAMYRRSSASERRNFEDYACAPSFPIYRKSRRAEGSAKRGEYPEIIASASLDDMLMRMDKGFADTLFYYIDKKGISDVEAYKLSNVGKKTFSKIKCNTSYKPSKITAVSFAIGLHLNLEETRHLLETAGMCLSRSSKFDVIIEYFIVTGNYKTIFDVNEVLYQFDQSLLGV